MPAFFFKLIIANAARELGVDVEIDERAVQDEVDNLASLYTGRSLEETPSPTPTEVPSETITPLVSATL